MTSEELLLALKDIQPPAPPVWWQVAPFWWILIFVSISIIGLTAFLKQRRNNRRLINMASRELDVLIKQHDDSNDSHRLLLSLSGWLKRVALLAYPEARLERLNGEAWLNFLDRSLGDDRFSRGPGNVFGNSVYSEYPEFNHVEIIQLCKRWMSAVSPVLHKQGKV